MSGFWCFWETRRVMASNALSLNELRNGLLSTWEELELKLKRDDNKLKYRIPLEQIVFNTYRLKANTNDSGLQGTSIFTNQLLNIMNIETVSKLENGKEHVLDAKELVQYKSHNLIKYTLAMMSIELDPEYAAPKPNSKNGSTYLPAFYLEKHINNQEGFPLSTLTSIMKKDLIHIEDEHLKAAPYHFLRAAIYFEIQRIEKSSFGVGRFARAQKIRDAMKDLDSQYKNDDQATYNQLREALESNTLPLGRAFSELPYSYALNRVTAIIERIDSKSVNTPMTSVV